MSEQQSAVERLADEWNEMPDYTPTVYDRGRVDQRHDMTMQLLEAIEADRVRAGVVAEEPEREYGRLIGEAPYQWLLGPCGIQSATHWRTKAVPAGEWVPVKQEGGV